MGSRAATLVSAGLLAAMVRIVGVSANAAMEERCDSIAVNNLLVWTFHNLNDP